MADNEEECPEDFQKILNDVEDRVEKLREQAVLLRNERENLLQVLQDVQDNTDHNRLTEADRDDLTFNTDRLIFRCLTVDVSVSTPRNESQEEAFSAMTKITDELADVCLTDPEQHIDKIESYLNACLPEPLSSNIDSRFQSKLLGCTVDDQKYFKKTLQSLHKKMKEKLSNSSLS